MPKFNPGNIIKYNVSDRDIRFKVLSISSNSYKLEYTTECIHGFIKCYPGDTWECGYKQIDTTYELIKLKQFIKDPRPEWL